MQSAAPCPSLEDLAAFLDGRLPADQRLAIVGHLAACDECREIFAIAAGSRDETLEAEDAALLADGAILPGAAPPFFEPPAAPDDRSTFPLIPGRPRLPPRVGRRWRIAAATALPIAALLLATLGFITLYRRNPADGLSSDRLAELVPRHAGATTPWGRRLRGEGGGGDEAATVPPALESFQLGVRQMDLRLALAAGDSDGTSHSLSRLTTLFKQMDLLPPETLDGYRGLATSLNGKKEDEAKLPSLLPKADELEKKGFEDAVIEPEFAALGRWTEACRLSATAGRDEIFGTRQTTRLLDWLLAPDPESDAASPSTDKSTTPAAKPASGAATTRADRLHVAEAPGILREIQQNAENPTQLTLLGEKCRTLLALLDPD
jgi:hypothetical protein